MDKLVAFFKNVWFKRGVALLCWAYTGLMAWVAWLNFAFYFEYENPTSLFVLYLFANIAALGLMIYTRKQVITMVNCMVLPVIVFAIVLFGLGNWYLIIPPLCVIVAMFFINTANETLKTVMGTMYLLMYVIGIAAFVAIEMMMGKITFTDVDLAQRDTDYEVLSPSGEYRIVRYIGDPSADRQIAMYYVEYTGDDTGIPFGYCKKVFGCKHALSSKYTGKADDPIEWVVTEIDGEEAEMLSVEGSLRENPYFIEPVSETAESDDLQYVDPFGEETAETAASDETTASQTAEAAVSTAEAQ
ncbi:MAG: hypothetical protein IJZ95_07930 [Oscillospiraceae bacterium]|nr:hypothetical protein [Oscillospiraceae bacterium]